MKESDAALRALAETAREMVEVDGPGCWFSGEYWSPSLAADDKLRDQK